MFALSVRPVMDTVVFESRKDLLDLFVGRRLFVVEIVQTSILVHSHDCGRNDPGV